MNRTILLKYRYVEDSSHFNRDRTCRENCGKLASQLYSKRHKCINLSLHCKKCLYLYLKIFLEWVETKCNFCELFCPNNPNFKSHLSYLLANICHYNTSTATRVSFVNAQKYENCLHMIKFEFFVRWTWQFMKMHCKVIEAKKNSRVLWIEKWEAALLHSSGSFASLVRKTEK